MNIRTRSASVGGMDDDLLRAGLVGAGVVLIRPYYLKLEEWVADMILAAREIWRNRRARRSS